MVDRELATLRERWGVASLTNTLLGSAAEVCFGVSELLLFQESGSLAALDRARTRFRLGAEDAFGDRVSKWAASHLLDLSDDLERASPWTVLPPGCVALTRPG